MINSRGSSRQNLNSPGSKTRRRESVRQSSLALVRKSLIDRQVEHATLNKSQASLSPIHQLRNIELQSNRGFGANSKVAFFTTVQESRQEVGVSQSSLVFSSQTGMQKNMTDREFELIQFCEAQIQKITKALNRAYANEKSILKIDETKRKLKKLVPAKLALNQIIRAIKKRDYMGLTTENVNEVDQIKLVCPDIIKFHDDLKQMRDFQKGIFSK